jgi:predicted N-acyltransferase
MTAQLYGYDLASRATEVETTAWNSVCSHVENPFLDLRFLTAVERSFVGESRMWFATFRDDADQPIACTCFSEYLVDGALMASGAIERAVGGVRRLWPRFLKYKILLCGTPVSTCGNQLAIAPGADLERLIPTLDAVAMKLAKETGCALISFKEFRPAEADRLSSLTSRDFLQARSVVAYHLPGEFGSFENYVTSRSKRTRANIRRHFRKFESLGLTCEELRGRDGVDRLFTDEVHRLYLNVLDRAHVKFERVPAEFFRELARQLPDESRFTIIRRGERIVAFCCGVASDTAHTMLFCGLDYSLNAEADLYFNTIYRGLSQGLTPGVGVVHIGASADEFKQHMGCQGEPLSVYVKALGAVQQFVFRRVFGLLFDTTPLPPAAAVTRENPIPALPAPDRKAA